MQKTSGFKELRKAILNFYISEIFFLSSCFPFRMSYFVKFKAQINSLLLGGFGCYHNTNNM